MPQLSLLTILNVGAQPLQLPLLILIIARSGFAQAIIRCFQMLLQQKQRIAERISRHRDVEIGR